MFRGRRYESLTHSLPTLPITSIKITNYPELVQLSTKTTETKKGKTATLLVSRVPCCEAGE